MKLNDSKLFRQQALINGEWLDANNGEVIDVTNPANGDKLGSIPKMGADETRAAIDAANRLYVQDGVYDRFAEKLQQAVSKLHIGDELDNGVTIGPLIDEKAVAKVEEHIADALEKGARVVCGGKAHERGGNFFQPTILVGVPADAKVSKEETFGPLAPLFRFKDEADVIAQANDTEFGLAAYFYARDLSRVFRVGEALEYGIVGINTGIISNEVAPFGGIKASGLGREGSKYGIEDYLEIKYMCIGL